MFETKVAPVLCVQGFFQAVAGECRIHIVSDKGNFNIDFIRHHQMIIMILSKLSMTAYLQKPATDILFSRFWQQNSLIIDFNNKKNHPEYIGMNCEFKHCQRHNGPEG